MHPQQNHIITLKSLIEQMVNGIQQLTSLKQNFSKPKFTQNNYEEQRPLLNQFLDPGTKKCLRNHRIQIKNGANSEQVPNSSHHIFF